MIRNCRSGLHPMTKHNVMPSNGQCRTCRRIKTLALRGEEYVPKLCATGRHDLYTWGRHAGKCAGCTVLRSRAYRARNALKPRPMSVREPQAPDGWEDEFGPVPPRVPDTAWVDWIAVQRFVRGEDVGRDLTKGEYRALHLLEVIRAGVPELESAV